MGRESKSTGVDVKTNLAPSLFKKFKKKTKEKSTSMAQVLRDAAQSFVKS